MKKITISILGILLILITILCLRKSKYNYTDINNRTSIYIYSEDENIGYMDITCNANDKFTLFDKQLSTDDNLDLKISLNSGNGFMYQNNNRYDIPYYGEINLEKGRNIITYKAIDNSEISVDIGNNKNLKEFLSIICGPNNMLNTDNDFAYKSTTNVIHLSNVVANIPILNINNSDNISLSIDINDTSNKNYKLMHIKPDDTIEILTNNNNYNILLPSGNNTLRFICSNFSGTLNISY